MVLVMTPKEDFKKEMEEEEQKKLAAMVAGLTQQDKESVYKKGRHHRYTREIPEPRQFFIQA